MGFFFEEIFHFAKTTEFSVSVTIPIICQGISGRRPSTKKQLAIFGI
jgi:hypothetical protein